MNLKSMLCGLMLMAPAVSMQAQEVATNWHARTLGEAVWQVALFAILGVVLAIIGYKLFDLATPGKLHQEILQNKNVAAAIIGAAVILGVCVLVAAAMLG
jgi:putative membrane protein